MVMNLKTHKFESFLANRNQHENSVFYNLAHHDKIFKNRREVWAHPTDS